MAKAAGGDRDSRLNGARVVGLNGSVSGTFPRNDLDDLVRFNTSERSSFDLKLSGVARRNNVDVQVYQFIRPVNDVLKSIGKIDFRKLKAKDRNANFRLVSQSTAGGNRDEAINTELDTGDYFIRVLRRQGNNTKYVMQLSGSPVTSPTPGPTPIPGPTPTPTPGPTPTPTPTPTPIPVIPLPSNNTVAAQLNNTTNERRYSINVGSGDYQFNLTGLNADADLQILALDGSTVLKSSSNTSTTAERIIRPLDAGKYILRVFRKAGNSSDTNFNLTAAKLTDTIKNTEAEATDLGIVGAPAGTPGGVPPIVVKQNYVVAGGKDSPVDYLKFKLPSRGFVKVELTGKPIDGDTLFGNLDVDLYAEGQPINSGLTSASLGQASEVFGGTLNADTTYFVRIRPQTGSSDGSTYNFKLTFSPRNSQPSIVRDTLFGDASSQASNFTEVGGLSYFSADSTNAQGTRKTSLWLSEGTLNKTTKLYDFNQGSTLKNFTNVNGKLYFVANDGISGNELWTSDGTAAGTKLVADLNPGSGNSNPTDLTAVGSDLYFYTSILTGGGLQNKTLYRFKQGSSAPQALTSTDFAVDPMFDNLTNVGGTLYFSATDAGTGAGLGDNELWRVNVTGSGASETAAVEEMRLRPAGEGGSSPSNFINAGGKLFLTANVAVGDQELLRINSFATGAFVPNSPNITTFNLSGTGSANAGSLAYAASTKTLYFAAADTGTGIELRKLQFTTDTSEAVTPALVKDINVGVGSANSTSSSFGLLEVNGQVIFSANDGTSTDLWISDGTDANTRKLSSLTGLSGLSGLSQLKRFTVVDGKLFFVATDATSGEELRKITFNGATQATLETFDIRTGVNSSSPNSLAAIGNQLFFVANDGVNGNEPWSIPA